MCTAFLRLCCGSRSAPVAPAPPFDPFPIPPGKGGGTRFVLVNPAVEDSLSGSYPAALAPYAQNLSLSLSVPHTNVVMVDSGFVLASGAPSSASASVVLSASHEDLSHSISRPDVLALAAEGIPSG
eukprot:TRINITY_DN11852_c0_g1_i1.p3 TRINITY_DN11852_c0_g1~~TRINITY_DN11852_c0_g1_i1.p3  ORF type:complete len:126 (+),score=7.50 TRINITY_DN11852_c0_g1_i1:280-657(+)